MDSAERVIHRNARPPPQLYQLAETRRLQLPPLCPVRPLLVLSLLHPPTR